MGKRAAMATTPDEARKLSDAELEQHIARFRWRVGAVSKSTLRNSARKILAMLEKVKAERNQMQGG